MLLENFIFGDVIFTCKAIFSTLYIGKSSGKQDHCDLYVLTGKWQLELKNRRSSDITNFIASYESFEFGFVDAVFCSTNSINIAYIALAVTCVYLLHLLIIN